jgi:Domain of unknown function (DUF4158)
LSAGYSTVPEDLTRYGVSSARRRHMLLIRGYVGVKEWGHEAELAMQQASQDAARTLEDLADIINVVLEQLIRQRYELPAFSILHRAAQHARATINREYQQLVCGRLEDAARRQLDILLCRVEDETKSPWHRLKQEPKQPTAQNNRDFLDHLAWLREQAIPADAFQGIPDVKAKQFAAEARSLDVASINDLTKAKRLTLAAALVLAQIGHALDDAADMFVRVVQRLHNQAYDALLNHQAEHVERTDSLVAKLHGVTLAYRNPGTAEQLVRDRLRSRAGYRAHSGAVRGASGHGRATVPGVPRAVLLSSASSAVPFFGKRATGFNFSECLATSLLPPVISMF